MRKWIRRITVAAAALLLITALLAALIVWRVTRTPAWYTAAVDCSLDPAQTAEQDVLIGFQNWLARSGAGDPSTLPRENRQYTITLSTDQINALLAKWTDNLHGDIQTLRVHLGADKLTLMGNWITQGRVVGLTFASHTGASGRPAVAIEAVRVGEQGVPLRWVNAKPVAKLRAVVADLAQGGRPIGIDAHGVATQRTAKAYVAAALLALAQGSSVEPVAFISPQLSIDDTVPLNLTQAKASNDQLRLTFELLAPNERQSVIDRVSAALAAAK